MSKLKRSALKSVVKECLLEILSEGINTQQTARIQPQGNAVAQQELAESQVNEQSSTMKEIIAGITTDPILASVLSDTARTTLVEQSGADRQSQLQKIRSTGPAQSSASVQSQDESGNSHWAALAFADKK